MSSTVIDTSHTSRRRRLIGFIVAIAAALTLGGAGLAAVMNTGKTEANFSATTPVQGHVDVGVIDLTSNGSFSFSKLVPGKEYSSTVSFTNPGNVGGTLTVGNPVNVTAWSLPAGQTPDWSQVQVKVPGSNVPNYTSLTALPGDLDMGELGAGATKNVKLYVRIVSAGDEADNELMGLSVDAVATAKVRTN